MAVQLINSTTALTGGGSTNQTPVGYCHDLTLVVHPDGSLTPNTVVLGNKGDLNIARLIVDVSELESAHVINPLSDYTASVIVYDPAQERSETNPCTYIMENDYWVVPESLLQTSHTYRCLFTLAEKSSGHTTPSTECWVSNEFTATVNDTLWSADIAAAIANPIIYSDTYGYLVKPPILLTPTADHYRIDANSTNLGMKQDVFVKRIEFTESGLDEGFVNKYGVFITNAATDNIYAVKFNEVQTGTYACLIPTEITTLSGAIQFLVVATTEAVEDNTDVLDDGFKRWVGNTLNFSVTDNFLEASPVPPVVKYQVRVTGIWYEGDQGDVTVYDGMDDQGQVLTTIPDNGDPFDFTVEVASGYLYVQAGNYAYDRAASDGTCSGGVEYDSSNWVYRVTDDGSITGIRFDACLVEGTLITLADDTQKPVEDITFDNDIKVWNFYEMKFDSAKPLWIMNAKTTDKYYKVTLEDGRELKLVGSNGKSHRLYDWEAKSFQYPQDMNPGKKSHHTYDDTGYGMHILSIEEMHETVRSYNIITDKHYNLYANGILTSCRLSNRYGLAPKHDYYWKSWKYDLNDVRMTQEEVNAYLERLKTFGKFNPAIVNADENLLLYQNLL